MAFCGHKSTQTPPRVQEATSTTRGFLSLPSSKTPRGHTPTQTRPEQGGHFTKSTLITAGASMMSQQLNKRPEYICSAQAKKHENWLSHVHSGKSGRLRHPRLLLKMGGRLSFSSSKRHAK